MATVVIANSAQGIEALLQASRFIALLSDMAFQFRKVSFRKAGRNTSLSRDVNAPPESEPRETHQKNRFEGFAGGPGHRALPGVSARGVELNDSFKSSPWRHLELAH
jgi:hypothetical protein